MNIPAYTLILNFYNKEPKLIDMQMESIFDQSHLPEQIWGCFFGCPSAEQFKAYKKYSDKYKNIKYIVSDHDFKYIGRYQLAQTAPTDYIITLDDDRQPGEEYCKTMLEIVRDNDCIVQQYGWIIDKNDFRDSKGIFVAPFERVREAYDEYFGSETRLIECTYLCGGMVFKKSHLKHLFSEDVYTIKTGEDIMFCMRAAKNKVPVLIYRPTDDKEILWHDQGSENTNGTVTALKQNSSIAETRNLILKNERF